MAARFIYITASSLDEAKKIGRALVEERLAACVNIIGPVHSIYRWQGAIQEEPEVSLIAKSRAELVEKLTARVIALHSYTNPCVVSLAIEGGSAKFLDWIASETAQAPAA